MNPRPRTELAIQITDAVSEAHASGFVHGGLSPESVMVTSKGHAKIPTFHLASQGRIRSVPRRADAARLRLP
jgi:serine/threonine protein kinase